MGGRERERDREEKKREREGEREYATIGNRRENFFNTKSTSHSHIKILISHSKQQACTVDRLKLSDLLFDLVPP